MTPTTILFTPNEQWQKLVGWGQFGSRPPMAYRPWCEDYGSPTGGKFSDEWVFNSDDDTCSEATSSLVIAFMGGALRDSKDRLAYALAEAESRPETCEWEPGAGYVVGRKWHEWPAELDAEHRRKTMLPDSFYQAWALVLVAEARGMGTAVFLP